jgi:Calcineurin-like phosphoesterase
MTGRFVFGVLFLALATLCIFPGLALAQFTAPNAGWTFAVSGDSRNCGDVVMPGIAAGVKQSGAAFYWHLGDFRKNSDFDEDIQHQPEHLAKPLSISAYQQIVWDDFLQNQIAAFGSVPVFLGIGNHETVWPHTREMYLIQFADWLDTPVLQRQRLSDDGNAHKLITYYHSIQNGVDFITLDNAVNNEFDADQLKWFEKILARDASNPQTHTIVVGMHEALPDSIAANHAMDDSPAGIASGRRVYSDLLNAQNEAHKLVYVIASHQHFYMAGVFNTAYWREHGGILPGWIVGTAGAVRYALPPAKADAKATATNVYGFLLGTVQPGGEISFVFHQLNESDVPPAVVETYKPEFVHWCFAENSVSH